MGHSVFPFTVVVCLPNRTKKKKGLSFQQDPPRRARIFTRLCLEAYGDVSTIDYSGSAPSPSLTLPFPPLSPECEMRRGLTGFCIHQQLHVVNPELYRKHEMIATSVFLNCLINKSASAFELLLLIQAHDFQKCGIFMEHITVRFVLFIPRSKFVFFCI